MAEGELHSADSLFLRVHVGTAKDDLGDAQFEMSTSTIQTPMIRSVKTGKYWTIGWQRLIEMAIDAGIEEQND